MAPRAFERPATIAVPGDDLVLEGLHVPAPDGLGGAVLAPPHPMYGGSMESPVLTELAHACERASLESLRFNWRGVGASQGRVTGDPHAAVADYRAALDWMEDTVDGPLVACGYSFGAATAVSAAVGRKRVRRLLLVAPPPAMLDREALASFPGRVDVIVGDRDDFAPLDVLEPLVAALERARFEVIPETDHFFMTGLPQVSQIARSFLGRGG
jgi:alpha/beta superfamily hydrolase